NLYPVCAWHFSRFSGQPASPPGWTGETPVPPPYDSSTVLACRLAPGANGVLDTAILRLSALQIKPRLFLGPLHNETQHRCLPAFGAVIAVQLDVVVGEGLPAFIDALHRFVQLLQFKHRKPPHFPIRVSGMRIIRVLDGESPAILEAVPHLRFDLVFREVGQIRKSSLCNSHDSSLHFTAQACYRLLSKCSSSHRDCADGVGHIR